MEKAQKDTMNERKKAFAKVVTKFRKKLTDVKLDIKHSPTFAWFQFLDNSRIYLIEPNEILSNEIWGDCKARYNGKNLTISCVISPMKKIIIENFEEFFKKDKELPVNFHDGTGFNFMMNGKMMSDTTINVYKDGNTMVFKSKY